MPEQGESWVSDLLRRAAGGDLGGDDPLLELGRIARGHAAAVPANGDDEQSLMDAFVSIPGSVPVGLDAAIADAERYEQGRARSYGSSTMLPAQAAPSALEHELNIVFLQRGMQFVSAHAIERKATPRA